MAASASNKANRQSRKRKPAVTTQSAAAKSATTSEAQGVATKPPATAKTSAKKTVKPEPVLDLRSGQPEVVQIVPVEPETVVDLSAQVALAAYFMWEQGVPGDADSHWHAAERLVRG